MNRITLDAITRQAYAMAVDVFEIGLYRPAVDGKANEPEMLPRTWDKATLLKSVGWLKYQNSQGRSIYIRPKGEHDLSLVDDLPAEAVRRMKATGFTPATVVETSPGNFQAWLKHPLARKARAKTVWTDGRPWTCMGPLMLSEIERLRKVK